MPDDLAGAHAARIHRHDLLVEAGEAALVFRDQLRVEACLAVTRDRQVDPPGVGQHRLGAVTVAAVARLACQVVVHIGAQHPLGQRLLQAVEQAVRVKRGPGICACQKLVQELVGNVGRLASGHGGSPLPSCQPTHKNSDSPPLGRPSSGAGRGAPRCRRDHGRAAVAARDLAARHEGSSCLSVRGGTCACG